ncbi:serine/threonine-protein kinase lmtk1 [Holotrichia oblita]|uniref:Serine/threonine-protein kinase lmtk1 n=1 Tax=Holotrichia oblita TaxID=644536 RepID=A0ACB9TTR4_HOLOL|nr:serine/threonine-protein kinase lmtk1 [Holotrichia oblita]
MAIKAVILEKDPQSCSQEDYKDGDIDASSWFDGSEKDFPRTKLKYIRELGKGWFGRVVEGTAQNITENPEWTPVVVRILEASATSRERLLFLNDVVIYKCGYHPNILRVLGRSLDTVPLLLLQEYCSQGDLKKYLKMCKAAQDKLVPEDMPLKWCYQLTLALKFLHDQKLTHPDLAARNCQLSHDLSLKLGDYGLSASYYPEDYYQGSPGVPLRWCAPEIISYTSTTIQTTPITVESNVWAFGVTMWEILEWGQQPYQELMDDEVISQVLGAPKVRLPRPSCHLIYTDYMYKIMQSCWYSPESRITVSQIELMMTDLMQVYEHTKVPSDLNSDIYEGEPISLEDFDARWNALKPNLLLMRDADILEGNRHDHQKQDHSQKSASLNNLHGSLDNLLDNRQFDPMESWLENVASDTSDMSFVRGLSEAITDLDNAIAMQNMSSSPEFGKVKVTIGGHFTSSESETEDENWRKKIERGAYTEKVRQKSRSVADLMVLTHIDCSESDSETLPSLDYNKANQRVRYLKSVDNQKKFGSEGNLFHVHDNAFQEELKKLQEERRDSLLFVPDKFSECSFSEDRDAATTSAFTPSSLSNNRLNSLENSPVKKLMEKLNSPSEMVPPQQVYNVFNVRVQHINVGGTVCDKKGETVDRSVTSSDIVNKDETAFSAICDRQIEKKYSSRIRCIKNQKLEHHESPNHIKIVYNPFKDGEHLNGNLYEGCIKKIDEQNVAFSKTENRLRNIDTYPCKNVESVTATTHNAINSTNEKDEIIMTCLKDFSEGKIGKDAEVKDSLPTKQKNFVKIEILNEQNFTPNVHRNYDMPNNLNNEISPKEILVTSKENSKNVKLKVPKLSEIIQRNAIDYKVHHHHSGTNDKSSVIPKSEENEKLLHQEIVDKDSGLNTPENSASLEKLYDDNEEILDIGSFDSDRSNETNTTKGMLLTELSNEEEHSSKEKGDEDYKESDREEEISKMIDFCVRKEAKLLCDLFLAHERSNCFTYVEDKLLVDNTKTIEIDSSTNNISNEKYSFLNYRIDMQNFIQAEICHSSNLLEHRELFLKPDNEKTLHLFNVQQNHLKCKYNCSPIEGVVVTNQELPITKSEMNESIHSSTGCKQMNLDKELYSFPRIVSEVVQVPDENESESFVINNFVDEDLADVKTLAMFEKENSKESLTKTDALTSYNTFQNGNVSESANSTKRDIDVALIETDNTELFSKSFQNLNNSQTQPVSRDSLEVRLDIDSSANIAYEAYENQGTTSNQRESISPQSINDKTATEICKQQCGGDSEEFNIATNMNAVENEIKNKQFPVENLVLQTKISEGENENIFVITEMEDCERSVAIDYETNHNDLSVSHAVNTTSIVTGNDNERSNTFFEMEANKPNILDITKTFICNEVENYLHKNSTIMKIIEEPNNVPENQMNISQSVLDEINVSVIDSQDVLTDKNAHRNIDNYQNTNIVTEDAASSLPHDFQISTPISNKLMECEVDVGTWKATRELGSKNNEALNFMDTELNSNITSQILTDTKPISGDTALLSKHKNTSTTQKSDDLLSTENTYEELNTPNKMFENKDQLKETLLDIQELNDIQRVTKLSDENNEHQSIESLAPMQIKTPNVTAQNVHESDDFQSKQFYHVHLVDEVPQENSKPLNIETDAFREEDQDNQNSSTSIQQTATFLNNEIQHYSMKTTEQIGQNIESSQPSIFKEKLGNGTENQSLVKSVMVQELENTNFISIEPSVTDIQEEILSQNDIQPENSNKIPPDSEVTEEELKYVENVNSEQLKSEIIDAHHKSDKQNVNSKIERTSIFLNNEIENCVSESKLFKIELQCYSDQNNDINTLEDNITEKFTSNISVIIEDNQQPKNSTESEKTLNNENMVENIMKVTSIFLENEIKNYANLKENVSNQKAIPKHFIIEETIQKTLQEVQKEENKDDSYKIPSCMDLEDGLTKLTTTNDQIRGEKIIDTSNEITETSTFLKNEIENYVGNERRIDFDLSDTQEKMSLNSLTHISTFTSTPFANRRPNDSTVILGASDDYSIDYYSGLKTSVDPEEGADLQFSSNFVRPNNTHDLYSLETWDNFLGRSFDEQENAAIDFNDFSQEPHSLLFLECDDDKVNEANDLKMTKVLNETYDIAATKVLNETYDMTAAPEAAANGTFTYEKNENINETFNASVDKTSDQIEADPRKNAVNNGNGSGWFLHPQAISKDIPTKTQETPSTSAPDESYVGFSMDDEIMAAIRNELLTKLPHAQRASSDHQIEENGEEMDSAERHEVFLRYNVYNTPLSPIPEESYDSEGGSGRITPKRINDTSDDEGDSSDWSVQEDNNSSNARTEEIISPRIPESPARYRTDPYRHTPSQDSCCSNDTLFNVEELNGGLNDKMILEPIFNQLDNPLDSMEDETSDSKYLDCNVDANTVPNERQLEDISPEKEQRLTVVPVIKTEHNYIIDFLDNERYSEMNMCLDACEEMSSTSDIYLTVSENTFSFGQNVAPLNSPEDRPWKEIQASFRDCDEDQLPKGTHSEETYICQKNSIDNSSNDTYHIHNTVLNKQDLDITTTPIQNSTDLKDDSFVNQLGEVEELDDCLISDEDIDKLDLLESNSKEYDKSVEGIYVNLSENNSEVVVKDFSFNEKCCPYSNDTLYVNLTKTEDRKLSSPPSIDDEVFVKMTKTESGESFNTEDSSYSDSVNTLDKHPTALGYENIKTSICDEDELYSKLDADDSDKFSRFEDLFGPLTDIRFSGPGSSSQIMSTSFSESNDLGDDQDWDSGSDTRSSSSGEFIWKVRIFLQGKINQFLIFRHIDYVIPMENIQEEEPIESHRDHSSSGSSSGSEGEDECPEFVPSAWDKYATPTKSALRSPEKTLERNKEETIQDQRTPKDKKSKGVWFKKQKYHCVYEYPREPESPVLQSYDLWKPTPDYATLSDWDLDSDPYLPVTLTNPEILEKPTRDNFSKNLYHLNTFSDISVDPNTLEEDFFVSSSSKPFDMLTGLTSQFFPGRQFPNDMWTENINMTPDSGVEDIITPATFIDETDSSFTNKNRTNPQLTGVQSLKVLAATAAERSGTRRDPSAFTSNRTFSIDTAAEEIVTRQVPTFTTFGKSRFLVQHVDTPPDSGRTDKNVSFEALPHKKPEPQTHLIDVSDWRQQKKEKQKIESVRGEASLLDSADEDSGIESCTLDRKRFNI